MLLSMLPATALAETLRSRLMAMIWTVRTVLISTPLMKCCLKLLLVPPIIIKEDVTADEAFTVTDVTIDLGGNKLTVGAGGN